MQNKKENAYEKQRKCYSCAGKNKYCGNKIESINDMGICGWYYIMKKIFKIKAEKKCVSLIPATDEYFIFAKNISEAIKKVTEVMHNRMHITEAELHCEVEEDIDLKKSMEK